MSVYERLRNLLLTDVADGVTSTRTEAWLAERLGVSRTPVREALNRLEQDGLVARTGRGVRIKVQSPEEILEIYGLRVILEAAAARGAATRHTDLDLSRLEALHTQMLALPFGRAEDVPALVSNNIRFHELLWRASHNATLVDMMFRLTAQLSRYPESTLGFPGRWEQVLAEHEALLEGVKARDVEAAGEAASRHMTLARDVRLRIYAANAGDSEWS